MTPSTRAKISSIFNHDWVKIAALIGGMFAALATAEHRMTSNENNQAEDRRRIIAVEKRQDEADKREQEIVISQARITTMLDAIDRRHAIEDEAYHPKRGR